MDNSYKKKYKNMYDTLNEFYQKTNYNISVGTNTDVDNGYNIKRGFLIKVYELKNDEEDLKILINEDSSLTTLRRALEHAFPNAVYKNKQWNMK